MESRFSSSHPWRVMFAVLSLVFAYEGHADVFRPAYLELRQTGHDRYDVMWKVPAQGDVRLAVEVQFPSDTLQITRPRGFLAVGAYIERWQVSRAGGFVGQTICIQGITSGVTDVIVRIERHDGTSQVERLSPATAQFVVKAPTSTGAVAWSYLVLGIEHILGGIDHLLFVLAMLLIVRGVKRLTATITAFTMAHSMTLAAATLGWVHVPGPLIEAMIALSIVFVAAEIVRSIRGQSSLTTRAPWVVAFSFGLLHGLGFAGALAEVGLPQKAIPIALLTFNLGVEIGQLLFVGCALATRNVLSRNLLRQRAWTPYALPYAIGAVAMFWTIDRVTSCL